MRNENTQERKFASTGPRTHNHLVMSLTRSPLSHLGGAQFLRNIVAKGEIVLSEQPWFFFRGYAKKRYLMTPLICVVSNLLPFTKQNLVLTILEKNRFENIMGKGENAAY